MRIEIFNDNFIYFESYEFIYKYFYHNVRYYVTNNILRIINFLCYGSNVRIRKSILSEEGYFQLMKFYLTDNKYSFVYVAKAAKYRFELLRFNYLINNNILNEECLTEEEIIKIKEQFNLS
jgi:hypothetical protein